MSRGSSMGTGAGAPGMSSMAQGFTSQDEVWMRRALALAARGQGRVEPNPMVGCVLVRNGRVVGEGYHRRFGGPHAEVNALSAAGVQARGATVYVTLEPCCHFGKTPPCTDALVAAGSRKVIAAMRDPFPAVGGRGLRRLRSAGIEVVSGLCQADARRLNGPYLKRLRTGQPWVILKWAQSLDGKIATRTGDSRWISSRRSTVYAHRLRGRVDALIVGVGTVVADDPLLTCRHVRPRRIATRIVLDPTLRTPLRARLVRTAGRIPTIIVTGRQAARGPRRRRYERAGVNILGVRSTRAGLDLKALLEELGRRGMTNVMVEGGGRTLGAFYDAGLADELVVFVARRIIGGRLAPSPLSGEGPRRLREIRPPVAVRRLRSGPDDLYHVLLSDPTAAQTGGA